MPLNGGAPKAGAQRQGGHVVMTHRPELDAHAEIPTDFTSHLAERLQLAPDAVLAHLESWLVHYPRPHREAPEPPPEPPASRARPHVSIVPVLVG